MAPPEIIDDKSEEKLMALWKSMDEEDRTHFINQVALALSIWGSDEKGKRLVLEVLRMMSRNGTKTLADFGLYVERIAGVREAQGLEGKVTRAATIIEGYRIKNALSSEPHRDLDI